MTMRSPNLKKPLRGLRLSGMIATLEAARIAGRAASEMDFLEAFSWLVQDELDRRRSRLLDRRFAHSGLTRAQGPRRTSTGATTRRSRKREILELATLKFIDAREDALLIGRPAPARVMSPRRSHSRRAARLQRLLSRGARADRGNPPGTRARRATQVPRARSKPPSSLVIDDLFLREAAAERRRRTRRRAHEPLRKISTVDHVESANRGLGRRSSAMSSSSRRFSIG